MKNLDADVRGGGGFVNSDTPGQGEGGWFENPRFWRTSFVDGPLATSCDIITWALQDEIKSFNILKLHFNMVMISKHVKSFK